MTQDMKRMGEGDGWNTVKKNNPKFVNNKKNHFFTYFLFKSISIVFSRSIINIKKFIFCVPYEAMFLFTPYTFRHLHTHVAWWQVRGWTSVSLKTNFNFFFIILDTNAQIIPKSRSKSRNFFAITKNLFKEFSALISHQPRMISFGG